MIKSHNTNFKLLFDKVLMRYNTDLSMYAMASLDRRLERFLSFNHFTSTENLIDKLINDSVYFDYFIREITVNTTEMFRDPSCWEFLRNDVLPDLKHLPSIRIWHAGCSSGEEVYSMAILLHELGLLDKSKIIATDLNKKVIEDAKNGIYSKKNMIINEENYLKSGGNSSLSNYYNDDKSNVVMKQDLLKNVQFMRYDLSTGKLFSKFDMIMCRNVMIYFNKELQENVFSLFQKSLFKNGYLVIGKKESMAYYTSSKKFTEYNSTEKIFKLL